MNRRVTKGQTFPNWLSGSRRRRPPTPSKPRRRGTGISADACLAWARRPASVEAKLRLRADRRMRVGQEANATFDRVVEQRREFEAEKMLPQANDANSAGNGHVNFQQRIAMERDQPSL